MAIFDSNEKIEFLAIQSLDYDRYAFCLYFLERVDVDDALTSDRLYRRGWPKEKVLEHIRLLSGSHSDPQVATEFLKMAG